MAARPMIAARAAALWTIMIAGASLLTLATPLRLQFGLPGFQADFSTDFGAGRTSFSSSSASAGTRGISSRSSGSSYDGEGLGRIAQAPQAAPGRSSWSSLGPSGLFGSGFLRQGLLDLPRLPNAPWGWPTWPGRAEARGGGSQELEGPTAAASSSATSSAGLTASVRLEDEAGAFASLSQADIPFDGSNADGLLAHNNDGILLTLFTRQSSGPERLSVRDTSSLLQSTFDPKRETKILIHGFYSSTRPGSACQFVKDAYLQVADVNAILVDWSGVDNGIYPLTVRHVLPKVGAEVADLIKALVQHRGAREDDFHIIGHSLGAQIAGIAGKAALGPNKGWITGLDPAGPMFEGKDASRRLSQQDAGFVEAIHTDGGYLGIVQPVAHVDYYVDGGMHRHPDCGVDFLGLCSHCFAFEVLAHAITNKNSIVGVKCDLNQEQRECEGNERIALGVNPNYKSRGSFKVDSGIKPSGTLQDIGHARTRTVLSAIIDRATQPLNGAPGGFRC